MRHRFVGWGMPRYTPEQRLEMVQLREADYTYQEIADHFGCSTGTVWRWVHRHKKGIDITTAPDCYRRTIKPEVQDRMVELWQGGMHNYTAIAREVTPLQYPDFGKGVGSLAVDYTTVKKILQQRGVL